MKEPLKIIKMEWIDKQNCTKYTTVIEKDGVQQDKETIINDLIDFVQEKLMLDTNNATKNQVNPLIIDVVTTTVSKNMSFYDASILLANNQILTMLRYSGIVSFYLMKYLEKNKLTLKTIEEHISKQDVEDYVHFTNVNQVLSKLEELGFSYTQIVQDMYKKKYITKDDLKKMDIPQDILDELTKDDDKPDSQN